MDRAHYMHATAFVFEKQTHNNIVEQFNREVSHDEVQCWYDEQLHIFHLQCPSHTNADLDSLLWAKLSACIAQELAAADSPDHKPKLLHFPECTLDGSGTVTAAAIGTIGAEPTTSSSSRPIAPSMSMHIIVMGDASTSYVRMFDIDAIPWELCCRIIEPDRKAGRRLLKHGKTCRAVRWNEKAFDYVFDGKIGEHAGQALRKDWKLLSDYAVFHNLQDERTANEFQFATGAEENQIPVSEEHGTEDKHGINTVNWLISVKETEQVEPGAQADMPLETQKLLVRPTDAVGRLRIPKGATLESQVKSQLSNDDSDESEPRRSGKSSFSALLALDKNDAEGAVNRSDDESASSSGTLIAADDRKLNLAAGAQTGKDVQPVAAAPSTTLTDTTSNRALTPSGYETTLSTGRGALTTSPALSGPRGVMKSSGWQVQSMQSDFGSFDKSLAEVDKIGLTADIRKTALLQLERRRRRQHSDRQKASAASSLLLNASVASSAGRDSPVVQSTQRSVSSAENASLSANQRALQRSNTRSGTVSTSTSSWTNKIVEPTLSAVPNYATPSSEKRIAAPPGLASERGRHIPSQQVWQTVDRLPVIPHSRYDIMDMPGSLGHLSGEQDNSIAALSQYEPLQPSRSCTQPSRPEGPVSSDAIVEVLQTPSEQFALKRDTMAQKAQNKSKPKKSGKKPEFSAQLPLPDPMLPPQPKHVSETKIDPQEQRHSKAVHISGAQKSQKLTKVVEEEADEEEAFVLGQVYTNTGAGLVVPGETTVGALFSADGMLADLIDGENVIEADIGMIVSRPTKMMNDINGSYAPNEAEERLNRPSIAIKSDFFSRVTTSASDARRILNLWRLSIRDFEIETQYEIHFRAPDGNLLKATVTDSDKSTCEIVRQGKVQNEIFMHYPVHVWDARIQVKSGSTKLSQEAIKPLQSFVSSMETIDQAPKFKAMVTKGYYPVSVLAKRVYTCITSEIKLSLEEVQELQPHSLHDQNYNFAAVNLPRSDMLAHQLLWWEVKLSLLNASQLKAFQNQIDFLVQNLDDVGHGNEGLRMKKKAKELDNEDGPTSTDRLQPYLSERKLDSTKIYW